MNNQEYVVIVRYGELYLKGKNRYLFENALIKNIKNKLKDTKALVEKITGRIIISNIENNAQDIIERVQKVFGISSMSKALKLKTSISCFTTLSTLLISDSLFKLSRWFFNIRASIKLFPVVVRVLSSDSIVNFLFDVG